MATMLVQFRHFDGPLIRVDFTALETAAADIDEVVRAMNTAITDLNTSLDNKTIDWEGDARINYSSLKATWTNAANEIAILLNSIRTAVDNSKQRMLETELRNAERMGTFQSDAW